MFITHIFAKVLVVQRIALYLLSMYHTLLSHTHTSDPTSPFHSSQHQVNTHLSNHQKQHQLRQPKPGAPQSPLPIHLLRACIPRSIQQPKHGPRKRSPSCCARVRQTRDQRRGQHSDVVLQEVVVGALGAIEEVKGLFMLGGGGGSDLLRGGVGVGILLCQRRSKAKVMYMGW
jgi:hypothetical protein